MTRDIPFLCPETTHPQLHDVMSRDIGKSRTLIRVRDFLQQRGSERACVHRLPEVQSASPERTAWMAISVRLVAPSFGRM